VGKQTERKVIYFVYMYENRKKKLVNIILRRGRRAEREL
jgi:hypothetical protein